MGGDGIHPAAFVEPRDLTLRHDDGRDRGGVERLVLARVINRGRQRQELRDPTSLGGSLDAPGALDGGGGENSDPQAAVRPEGLLQGEVVGVDPAQVHGGGTRNRRAIDESERSGCVDPVDGGGHAR